MDLVQTLVNAAVVAIVSLVLGRMLHGQRQEHRHDIAALRTELKAEIGELRREMGEMRSDLTRVALAVGAEGRQTSR